MGCRRGSHSRRRRRRACRCPRRHLPPPPRRDASRRRRRRPRHRRSPASLTCVAHLRRHRHRPRHRRSPNRAAVSRRAAYASPRASNLTSATMVTYLPRPPLLCRRASPRRHRCRRRHRRHCVPRIAAATPPRLASSPPPLSPPPPPSPPSSLSPSSSPLCVAPTAPAAAVPSRLAPYLLTYLLTYLPTPTEEADGGGAGVLSPDGEVLWRFGPPSRAGDRPRTTAVDRRSTPHPPGRTDTHLCRCFGAPARRVSPVTCAFLPF